MEAPRAWSLPWWLLFHHIEIAFLFLLLLKAIQAHLSNSLPQKYLKQKVEVLCSSLFLPSLNYSYWLYLSRTCLHGHTLFNKMAKIY